MICSDLSRGSVRGHAFQAAPYRNLRAFRGVWQGRQSLSATRKHESIRIARFFQGYAALTSACAVLTVSRFPENPPDGRETSMQRENTPLEAETHNGGFYHALACANFVQRIPMREEFGHLPKTAGAKTFAFFLMLLALESKPKPPEGRR